MTRADDIDWGVAGQIAATTPERQALRVDGESITYGDLIPALKSRVEWITAERQALRTASIVPLFVDRSIESGLAILACICARIPCALFDSSLPAARRDAMIATLPARHPWWDATVSAATESSREQVIRFPTEGLYGTDSSSPIESSGQEKTGIVVFTSGTTGTPKGVVVTWDTFSAWSNQLWKESHVDFENKPTSFSPTPFYLLGIVLQLSRVMTGVDLVSINPTAGTPSQFLDALIEANPTFVRFPAQLAKMLGQVQRVFGRVPTRTLEVQLFGDGIRYETLHEISRFFPATTLFSHVFSSTEVGLTSFGHRKTVAETPAHGPVALDFLSHPPKVLLVPANHELSGASEVWISGAISAGYLGNPELTQSRFVIRHGLRWWKSGDLVKPADGGGFVHVGRLDDIVKIRGFSVSPSEVEKALYQDGQVRAASVVLISRDERKFLAAFVVVENSEATIAEITRNLTHRVPEFMVPSFFQIVQALPATQGGKIDRAALARLATGEPETRKGQS